MLTTTNDENVAGIKYVKKAKYELTQMQIATNKGKDVENKLK